jgi:hypothetical protein
VPSRDFDVARRAYDDTFEPVSFELAGETFTVLREPTLGDTFELHDAPDIDVEDFDGSDRTHLALVRVLVRFISHMLDQNDRPRFAQALYRIPVSHQGVLIEVATFITEQVVGRPTEPSSTSSAGPQVAGRRSKSGPKGG